MKKTVMAAKVILAFLLGYYLLKMATTNGGEQPQRVYIVLLAAMFSVVAFDLLTIRWRTRRKVVKRGVTVQATITEIVYPFRVYDSGGVSVSIGGISAGRIHIIRAEYVYDGIGYLGESGLLLFGADLFRAGEKMMVYIDPEKPERFYI